jgi:polysaccharide chain length determinant protein (PEP-CTERM system associated)
MTSLYDEFRIAVHRVWNRRWLALAVAWVVCLIGWLIIAMIPNKYESKAQIQIRTQTLLSDQVGIDPQDQRKNIQQIGQTLISSGNLEKVIRGTELGTSVATPAEMAAKIELLRADIEVRPEQDDFFAISVKQSSGKLARDVVQKLIDVAEDESIAGDRKEMGQTLRFLDAQIVTRTKELQEAEAKRVAYETENLGLLPGVGSVSQRMESSRAELGQIDSQLIQARSALAALNGQLAGTPSTLNSAAMGGGAPTALTQAQGELASMRARGFTDQHPDVVSIKSQITNLRAQGGGASGAGGYRSPNPAYSALQSMRAERAAAVTALQARKSALQSDMAQLAGKQTAEPGVAAEYQRIQRDYEVKKEQYDKLLVNRDQIRLRGQVESQTDAIQFRVVKEPSFSNVPAVPNRPLLLAAILIVGIGTGVASAFALGHVQTSFPTAAKLEKASGLPVIGSISQMLTGAERIQRQQKMKLFYGATGGLVGLCALLVVAEFVQRSLTA